MTDKIKNVKEVHLHLLKRYEELLSDPKKLWDTPHSDTSKKHLLWMLATAQKDGLDWPVDKMARWLGFIQGVLIVHGICNTEDERNYSRPLFHQAYDLEQQNIPKTQDRAETTNITEPETEQKRDKNKL